MFGREKCLIQCLYNIHLVSEEKGSILRNSKFIDKQFIGKDAYNKMPAYLAFQGFSQTMVE